MKLLLAHVVVDLHTGEVSGGLSKRLTDTERRVLCVLHDAVGQLVPREVLRERAWDTPPSEASRGVDRTVTRLRHKLGDREPRQIQAVYGQGYRLVVPSEAVTPNPWREPAVGDLGVPARALVGREAELRTLLEQSLTAQSLTVHGPPGIGRWRLLQEVAQRQRHHYTGGVWGIDGGHAVEVQLMAIPGVRGVGLERWGSALSGGRPTAVAVRHAHLLGEPDRALLEAGAGPVALWWCRPDGDGVGLPPLSRDESRRLFEDVTGSVLPEDMVDPLFTRCGGNPGMLVQAATLARVLPLDVVLAHIGAVATRSDGLAVAWSRCDPHARRLALRMSWCEHPLAPPVPIRNADEVHALTELLRLGLAEGDRGRARVPLALRSSLRALDPDPDDSWRRHLASLEPPLSQAHAAVYRGDGCSDLAAVSAELIATLTAHGDRDPTLAARAVTGLEAAATHLSVHGPVLALMERFPPVDARGVACLGRVLADAGHLDRALPLLEAAPDAPHTAAALARILAQRGASDQEVEAVLDRGERAPGPAWSHHRLQQWRARYDAFHGRWDVALRRALDDLQACRAERDRLSEARGTLGLGWIHGAMAQPARARPNLEAACEQLEALGERVSANLCRLALCEMLDRLGDVAEAVRMHERALAEARRMAHPDQLRLATQFGARLWMEMGDVAAAEALLRSHGSDLAQQTPQHGLWAWVFALRGQADQACDALVRALSHHSAWDARILTLSALYLGSRRRPTEAVVDRLVASAGAVRETQNMADITRDLLAGRRPRPERGDMALSAARLWRSGVLTQHPPSDWAIAQLERALLALS